MRVAFLSVSDQLGGSEVMLLQIVRELRRTCPDWPLSVVLPGRGPLSQAVGDVGARVVVVPMPGALRQLGEWGSTAGHLPRAWRLARAGLSLPVYERDLATALTPLAPDVVHTNGFKAHIVAARLRLPAALVWHLHEYVSTRPLTRRLLARYVARASAIVANSRSVAADATRSIGAHPITIHNAVDTVRFSPEGRTLDLDRLAGMAAPPPGTLRVGLVATFSRWKGHETFLRAMAALPPELPLRGYVVGGPLYDTLGSQHSLEELRALAAQLGLADRIAFTGFASPADEALRALDIVVHASTDAEAFGLAIAEAMACGRAVISSGTGGSAELFTDGQDALAHRPGDARDLAHAIERQAAAPSLRARLGQAARRRAVEAFDAGRLGRQFADLYEAAVARRAA